MSGLSLPKLLCLIFVSAIFARAQAPAGPNRPPQVPENYVVTPFGYFHPSCVVHLAEGEELLEGGERIQRADGSIYTVPACEYPHYTARGEMFAAASTVRPPTITHSWIVSGSTITNSSYGEIRANWNVPSTPQSFDNQTLYFFPGLQDQNDGVSILQPVLGWNSDFHEGWGIASWNCCPHGTADESAPFRANPGDQIVGTIKSTCSAGTLSCPTWKITTQDQTLGSATTLNNTPSEGQTFNWTFGGVLEGYNIVQCSDYPPNNYLTFSPTLYDDNFNIVQNPAWSLTDWAEGLTPQCDYGGETSSSQVTLTFGSFNLTVSTSGSGSVISTDGSINCPGNCTGTYPATTPVTLNAYPAPGWAFTGWTGACTGTGSCTVTMTNNQTVAATFLPYYMLTVNPTGNGSVQSNDGFINCPGECSYSYVANTPVVLNAVPAPGWSVSSWGGYCPGTPSSCTIVMSQNESVPVTFVQDYYTLTVSMSGQGSITSTDGFINCPGTCSHTYLSLTAVTLNASPASGWNFSGWSGQCTGTGQCNLTMLGNYGVSAYFLQPGSGLQFSSVTPCRLIDTRQTNDPIQGGTSQNFTIPQLGGCNIPASASAYSLNVTVAPHGSLGYLTVWPAGLAQPLTSTMNSRDGRTKASAVIVQSGTGNAISIYASNTTDVLLDINGYFSTPGTGTYQYYPLTPCRVIDTRNPDGPLAGPPLIGGQERDFYVGVSTCIPAGVNIQAYSFNVTVVPYPSGQPLRYLTVWPYGETQPQVSTLNNRTATTVANAAIVPTGTDGGISVYASDSAQLIVDINGYFAAPGSGGLSLYPAPPCRVIDTRNNNGQPFQGELTVPVAGSLCAPPAGAKAYVFNATVVPPGPMHYLTLWADPLSQPPASTLNAIDGMITSNMAIVPNGDGSTDAYASDPTQLILDISSYFAP